MKSLPVPLLLLIAAVGCADTNGAPDPEAADPEAAAETQALVIAQYYVDPVDGVDALGRGTTPAQPWKTVIYARDRILAAHPTDQGGVVLNLRAGVLHSFTAFDKL